MGDLIEIARQLATEADDDPALDGRARQAELMAFVRDRIALYMGEHAAMGELLDAQRVRHSDDFDAPDPNDPRVTVHRRLMADDEY